MGVIAAAGLSADLTNKINTAILKVATAPAVKDRLATVGFEPNQAMTSTELTQLVKTDFDRNAAIVKQFDIKLQQ